MEIFGEDKIRDFASKYPHLRNALHKWIDLVTATEWKHTSDMKRIFGSADKVGKQTVFNVGGNKCRLIALVNYANQSVIVQYVLTHPEYDKGNWKS